MDFKVRLVNTNDAASILEIYSPFVLTTAASFETKVPGIDTFKERISQFATKSPWIVAELNGKIIGYTYATAHRSRTAYQWSQETTVYVHPDFRKQGIAKKLYTLLLDLLTEMGYTKALAIITLPNEPSIQFHAKLGFTHIGDIKNIGFKFNQWHTTSWWDLGLQTETYVPKQIKSVESIQHLVC